MRPSIRAAIRSRRVSVGSWCQRCQTRNPAIAAPGTYGSTQASAQVDGGETMPDRASTASEPTHSNCVAGRMIFSSSTVGRIMR
ncbi:hypothetical protein ACFQZ4_20710 [Catellatospora coxensis]